MNNSDNPIIISHVREAKYKNPIIGATYGLWTVISEVCKIGSGRDTYWRVRCKCGREAWRNAYLMVNGRVTACKSCCRSTNSVSTFINSYFRRVVDRAKVKNLDFTITPEYLSQLYDLQEGKCALSGLEISFRPNYRLTEQTASLDRKDNTKGYVEGNIQWVHKDVNMMKHVHSQEYFLALCKTIVQYSAC